MGDLRAPMLGRADELRRLRHHISSTGSARSSDRIVIVAPPGVGKSRLLNELASVAGGTVIRGRVRPQATAPFETVAQLVASLPDGDLGGALARAGVAPSRSAVVQEEIGRLLGAGSSTDAIAGNLGAEREARFDAWLAAIDALAAEAETWLIEDLHWAGSDLLAFLDHAGRAPTRHGRLIVATARPSLLEVQPAWRGVDMLELGPLPPADAGALITALLGTSLPDSLVTSIVERSDGTPLFIEELLRTWASVGTLVRGHDGWRLAIEPERVTLPETVQAIYAAQLDDLPPDARLVARRGAVAGRRVPTGALHALGVESTDGLDALRRRDLLAGPLPDLVTGEAYAYRHALLRDAGYASLARAERARLHVAMAGWLESVAGDRADAVAEGIAEHYASALDSRPALAAVELPSREALASAAANWYERAAAAALRLAAYDAATRHFRRSIELTDVASVLDVSRRRRRLGEVLAASSDLDAAIAELWAGLQVCGDHAPSVAASAYALGRAYMEQIRFGEAEQLAADTLDRLADQADILLARLHALHAWARAAQGQEAGVLEESELARAMARRAGDPWVELDVLDHTNAARDEVDATTEDEWVTLEERARQLGAWHHVISAARVRAVYRAFEGPAGALPDLEETAELARAHGQLEQAGWCDYSRCEVLFVLGRWNEALAIGQPTIDLAERNAYQRLAYRTYVVLLPIAAARGDRRIADGYRAWLARYADQLPAAPAPYARLLNAAAQLWMADADHEAAPPPPDEILESIIPMINPHFVVGVERVISAWLTADRQAVAIAGAAKVAAFAEGADATPIMRASSALLGALVGRADPADAVAAATAAGAPWWTARALRAAGRVAEAQVIEGNLGVSGG